MAKVGELKALKASYEVEVGAPFDPPKEDAKKKSAPASAGSEAKKEEGPSKNDLKKAAKAAAKDAKRADHKAAAAGEGDSSDPAPAAEATSAAAASAVAAASAGGGPAAAAGAASADLWALWAGATLHCCAATGSVACAALSLAPAALRKRVAVNAAAPPTQLARLVVAGGTAQVGGRCSPRSWLAPPPSSSSSSSSLDPFCLCVPFSCVASGGGRPRHRAHGPCSV
jgi:hypothetical protein